MTKTSVALIILILLAIGVATIGCERSCPEINSQAPEFSLESLDGQTVTLKDFKGKSVLLNFWQTNCSWCKYQMPFIQEISNKYSSSGLVALAVNVGESVASVKAYKDNGNYTTITFLLDKEAKANTDYCVPAFPATVFINKEGIIKDAKLGAFQTLEELENYLKSLN